MAKRSLACRVVSVVACAGLLTGCVQTRVAMVAKYQPGGPPKVDRTPDVGVYKIKYTTAADEDLKTLRGSKRFLGKGQPVGFEDGEDGQVIAVAGEERFPALLPEGARFCVWYTKSEEPTRFAEDLGDAAHVVGVGALAVGLVAGAAVLELSKDDDCRHGHKRKHCHKCRD
jgi:hypothetical protein